MRHLHRPLMFTILGVAVWVANLLLYPRSQILFDIANWGLFICGIMTFIRQYDYPRPLYLFACFCAGVLATYGVLLLVLGGGLSFALVFGGLAVWWLNWGGGLGLWYRE
jgi:hypothetical protein